jgi:hypothetical protein
MKALNYCYVIVLYELLDFSRLQNIENVRVSNRSRVIQLV